MLFHLFNTLREQIPGANVFRYVSTRIGLATLTSLLITFIVAPWFIRRARERQLGEVIRDDGPAGAREEEGDADDGRRADHHGAVGGHGAVVRPAQHAGLAGAAGHRRLRRHRLRRRLPEAVAQEQEGAVRARSSCSGSSSSALVAMVWLYTGDALPPDVAAAPGRCRSSTSSTCRPPRSPGPRCRWPPTSVRGVRADGGIERGQPDRRPRRPGDRAGDHLFVHVPVPRLRGGYDAAQLQHRRVPGDAARARGGRAGGVLRRDGRRRHRLPVVQHPPGAGVHGRRRRAGAGRRHRLRRRWRPRPSWRCRSSAACSSPRRSATSSRSPTTRRPRSASS